MTTPMPSKAFYSSLLRNADLDVRGFEVEPRPRAEWHTGDYVVVEVTRARGTQRRVELMNGRHGELVEGDTVVGALGARAATLEAVGSWRAVGEDGALHLLTAAGLLGKMTSRATGLTPLVEARYCGHACRDGAALRMRDFVHPVPHVPYRVPTVLIVGTSMSAGKTTTGRVMVRRLTLAGLRVIGAKLSGAGRYRDILAMHDAGADQVYDFVDVGLPSSIAPKAEFRDALDQLLSRIARAEPDVVVAEAGASPLEPYNGDVVLDALGDSIKKTVLCATDPYAVVGVQQAFGLRPDLICGLATSTSAGIELVEKLSGVRALNPMDPSMLEPLDAMLASLHATPKRPLAG